MDLPSENSQYIVTRAVRRLRDFLTRPGARHSVLVGAPGSGKTSAVSYLVSSLRADNYLVVVVPLREISSGDQLIVTIARAVLNESSATLALQNSAADDPLNQYRSQFEERFTVSQTLSDPSGVIDRLIELVNERGDFRPGGYIFLDGLDEMREPGDVIVALEDLAEHLKSASLVVTSRPPTAFRQLKFLRGSFAFFELDPFTESEVKEFLRRLLPGSVPQQIDAKELIERSSGNPVLLRSLAAQIWEYGTLSTAETLRTDTVHRFTQLLGPDRAGKDVLLLLTLLVFLEPVSAAQLTLLAGLSPERSKAALQKMIELAFIAVHDAEVIFGHESIRDLFLDTYVISHDIDINALQFGDEAAERDDLLKESFVPPHDLHSLMSGVKTIVLGDRGAGKSAIFRALQDMHMDQTTVEKVGQQRIVLALAQNPSSFVEQMTADDSTTSSAEGFKAIWLLYCAALAARSIDATTLSEFENTRAFVKDSRTILRQIGWTDAIKDEGRLARWWALIRYVIPEKVTLTLGPVTIEPNLKQRERGWLGNHIRIDEFIDRTDHFLQFSNRHIVIVFDQIDEAFKYERERQEALIQGLFLAESFLSLRQAIRLVVLLRTDLFELYDIQEKNKFVSRSVRLSWSRDELRKQLMQRIFSNSDLHDVMESLQDAGLTPDALAQVQLQIVFPTDIEGKPFEEWLFDNLKNGKDQIAPRQIILFLNLTKDNAKNDAIRRRIPLFSEREAADAMTRVSELSYQEVISDFRAATTFVQNCRAGKIIEFDLQTVQTLFDPAEGSVALQLDRLERLGVLRRIIAQEGDSLVPRFRYPRLFTRWWETSN